MNGIKNQLIGADYYQFKIRFLIFTIVCFIPSFAFLIAGHFLGYWNEFPTLGMILFSIVILFVIVAALTYIYFKNKFYPKENNTKK